jgi:(1->4)-alpha-D-glucan 1-alpha-D-glucosylmutase
MADDEIRRVPSAGARTAAIPRATYRVQLTSAFTLRDASALVPYLAELGVSHIYCSPYLEARPGSTHGYDVVDHNSINPEIGTRADLGHFVATLRAHSMGHVLDLVPNHVGIMGAENARWMDVLENGEAARNAGFFDIDWESTDAAVTGEVLVPVLGDHYGEVLERGELGLRFEPASGSFAVFYHEHRFPIDPRDYASILQRALANSGTGMTELERAELQSLVAAFGHLPDRREHTAASIEERDRDKEIHKRRLAALAVASPALGEAIAATVHDINGTQGDPASFDVLHQLLESQAYRLAYWRVAADEINYRRFFEVNDLAALRMENEAVFEATHRLVLELIAEGSVDGLRIDHPDGLYDPAQYFRRLQSAAGRIARGTGRALDAAGRRRRPIYLVVEKITAGFERLPRDWPVHGTTGYRFTNVVNGVLIEPSAKWRFDRTYRAFIGAPASWPDVAYESKRFIVNTSLAAELNVLASALTRIARAARRTRDITRNSLRQALIEIIACFPVYRTYVAATVSPQDRHYIEWALTQARKRGPAIDAAVYDFVRSVLLGEGTAAMPAIGPAARAFTMKFQQLTAPVMAKGVEDTACYRFNRLSSLNEVGGEPDAFGVSVRAFHADARRRAQHWPHELNATSTHDTKRSEDVRARIDAITELLPGEWRRTLGRWSRMNRMRKHEVDGEPAPSPNDEYLLYQTLIGSLPLETDDAAPFDEFVLRVEKYMIKAAREAKLRTSWASVNTGYEEALVQFVRDILDPRSGNLFLPDLLAMTRHLTHFGLLNSLSQTLLKLTAPGVPDTYQGCEIWDFSLVDPDNRRPIDYERRRRMLGEIQSWADDPALRAPGIQALLDGLTDGKAKLYVTWRSLTLRRTHEPLFTHGAYRALKVTGDRAGHLVAFARHHGDELSVTLAPRLYSRLLGGRREFPLGSGVWGDTRVELPRELPRGMLIGVFDGVQVPAREPDGAPALAASEVLASFPVALLATTGRQQAA